jgi:predicted 2-oxoglutarate/Fe(II)-dependent dioxygenase YbiX
VLSLCFPLIFSFLGKDVVDARATLQLAGWTSGRATAKMGSGLAETNQNTRKKYV